jgi:hypothetical protein
MKLFRILAVSTLLFTSATFTSNAWIAGGLVLCDANHNGQVDATDTPLPGILVVVTNTTGTFSNANWTSTPEGGYGVELPPVADSYVVYLHPLTLAAGTTFVLPTNGIITFSLNGTTTSNFFGNFLVSNPTCTNTVTPPITNTDCCLSACATIGGTRQNPLIRFTGSVKPSCGCTNGDQGEWDLVDNTLNLRLQVSVLDILNCGSLAGASCSSNYIDFQGAGTLVGINGSVTNYGVVFFSARAVDGGTISARDSLYLRVYTDAGVTLYLISSDTANPLNVAPLAISSGSIKVSQNCCENNDDHNGHGNGHNGDKGGKGGKGGNGDKGGDNGNGQGNGNGGKGGKGKGKH